MGLTQVEKHKKETRGKTKKSKVQWLLFPKWEYICLQDSRTIPKGHRFQRCEVHDQDTVESSRSYEKTLVNRRLFFSTKLEIEWVGVFFFLLNDPITGSFVRLFFGFVCRFAQKQFLKLFESFEPTPWEIHPKFDFEIGIDPSWYWIGYALTFEIVSNIRTMNHPIVVQSSPILYVCYWLNL